MDKLIKAIEAEKVKVEILPIHTAINYGLEKAINIINTHMEGRVIVPAEPTTEMIEAAARHCYSHCESYGVADTSTRLDAIRVYKAMLEATNAQ